MKKITKLCFWGTQYQPGDFPEVMRLFKQKNHTIDDRRVTFCIYKDGTFALNWGAYWSQSEASCALHRLLNFKKIPTIDQVRDMP